MSVAEAWGLAPAEIVRWLQVRGDASTEERLEFGRLIALGFNSPKSLGEEIRRYLHAKRMSRVSEKGGVEAVAEMFRMAGIPVIDQTKEE